MPEVGAADDTGANTNPARWLHENHWDSGTEVELAAAATDGDLGVAVVAGATRRIREITVRHAGTNNTVVTLKVSGAGGATRLTFDVPAQTTRVWSSEDGIAFTAGQQPAVQTSDVTGGNTFVSASGVQA